MSYADSYDECMGAKHLPLIGEILSRKTLSEAIAIFEEIDDALEGAGGKELTFAALAASAQGLGMSAGGLEVVGLLAAGAADLAVFVYANEAAKCLASAVIKNSLFSELDTLPRGTFKDQVQAQAQAEGGQTAVA
jgi:hypothetical protein